MSLWSPPANGTKAHESWGVLPFELTTPEDRHKTWSWGKTAGTKRRQTIIAIAHSTSALNGDSEVDDRKPSKLQCRYSPVTSLYFEALQEGTADSPPGACRAPQQLLYLGLAPEHRFVKAQRRDPSKPLPTLEFEEGSDDDHVMTRRMQRAAASQLLCEPDGSATDKDHAGSPEAKAIWRKPRSRCLHDAALQGCA